MNRERQSQQTAALPLAKPAPRLERQASRDDEAQALPLVREVLRAPGQPLEESAQEVFASHFGYDFSRVRVHTDERAAASAAALGASAYTVGTDVVFGASATAGSGKTRRERLAHELTHVVQQTAQGGGASYDAAEQEAAYNSRRLNAGLPGQVARAVPAGMIQCEEDELAKKKKADDKRASGDFTMESGTTIEPKKIKNKFGFTGNVTVKLTPDLKFGAVTLFEDLKIKTTGVEEQEITAETPPDPAASFLPTDADIRALQTEATLGLLKLKVPELSLKAGTFTLGANLGATGKYTYKLDEGSTPAGTLGLSASVEGGFKSTSLLPPRLGEWTLGTKLGGKASVEAPLGAEDAFGAKASATATSETEYKSPSFQTPFGLLGDRAKLTLGGDTSFSMSADMAKGASSKVGGSGTLGLVGTGKQEPFVKLKVSGEGEINWRDRKVEAATTTVVFTGGFKF